MPDVHQFNDHAMATSFDVRIADEDRTYAAQAAQAVFDLLHTLESRLSRFRADSDVARIAQLAPGETMRLSESTFACLEIAKRMEFATSSAFSTTPGALRSQAVLPRWTLLPKDLAIHCESGILQVDLGAIGKGFALDRMAELLRGWDCNSFLLVAGGSSVLAGDAPMNSAGWSCGLGNDHASQRLLLAQASLSGSGLAVKGEHIVDPRTGCPALRQKRAWSVADSAAESDALSTACMVLTEPEIEKILSGEASWLVFLETETTARAIGSRALTPHP